MLSWSADSEPGCSIHTKAHVATWRVTTFRWGEGRLVKPGMKLVVGRRGLSRHADEERRWDLGEGRAKLGPVSTAREGVRW